MSDNYQLILSAIKNKQQVTAIYQGQYREMCPHIIGTKNGKQHALFYQFAGESNSGPITPNSKDNWRCLAIDQLTDIKLKKGEWHTYNNYNQKDRCIDNIDIKIDL